MTTYRRDSQWGKRYLTELHLVYRIVDGKLEERCLFLTRPEAEQDLLLANARPGPVPIEERFQIADIICAGWGIVNGVIGRNGPMKEMTDEEFRRLGSEPLNDEGTWREEEEKLVEPS